MSPIRSLAAVVLLAVPIATQAQPGGQPLSLSTLLPYAGSYVGRGDRELAVSVRNTPAGPLLLLYDLRSDAVRALFPVARDSFVAGPELTRPSPPHVHAAFIRDGLGAISALRLTGGWFGRGVRVERRPLRTRSLDFKNSDVDLRGTVYLPAQNSTTAVVLAHGSEQSDRYDFDVLPAVLANHGFVVLAYDKRGTGASTGSWGTAGLDELAADLVAGINALKADPSLRVTKIGVVGTSEGGWVAPLAASKTPDIAFIVAISGGSVTKGKTFVYKDRRRAEETGLSGAALDSVVRQSQQIIEASAERVKNNATPSGFDRRVTYDPTPDWMRFRGSILSLGGEFDVLEDARRSAERLGQILIDANHQDFTIKVFPRAHHLLFLGTTGAPSEFSAMRGIHQVAPGYWDVLLRWMARQLAPR